MKVVHFINHFFAGIGGEEKADTPVAVRERPVGPGNPLQNLLPPEATIMATVFCGDNYFNENLEAARQQVVEIVKRTEANILLAGPAFDNGRFGVACVEVCHAVSNELGITGITAMYSENPGVDIYRGYKDLRTFVFPTAATVAGMKDALTKMSEFVKKLSVRQTIGPAVVEGYIPRGVRNIIRADRPACERAVAMLLAKIGGQPFTTEVPLRTLERVTPAPPVPDVSRATIALVNTSGVVPYGNPGGFKKMRNTHWEKYSIEGLATLKKGEWEAVHGGYNTLFINENPNLGMPLDAARAMEKERTIGRLHPFFYVTPGVQASVTVMQNIGREMAADMKAGNVDGVLLVST